MLALGVRSDVKWSKPAQNLYKVNVDACFMEDGSGATAAVLRNHSGEALTGSTTLFTRVLDATAAEALALKNCMELADQWGCSNVIFESDCLEIIQACKGEVDILSPYSATLNECFHLARSIGSVLYSNYPRKGNKVTQAC